MTLSAVELDDLKSLPDNDCAVIAGQWVTLRRSGGRLVGPCPLCSRNPNSRKATCFAIKDGQAWVCAKCNEGGDVIKLVMKHESIDFRAAVEWLGGARQVDPAIAEKRARERAEKEAKRQADSEHFRQRERKTLYDIWNAALPAVGSPVESYLRLRGIELSAAARLRCVPAMPYFHGDEIGDDGRKRQRVIHRGPAMVAPIVGPDGRFRGLHFTYIDLAQPNGKARIADPDSGEELPAKKVRGSKAGGHIDIVGSRMPVRIVIGEGIETVLSVWLALVECGQDVLQTAFWSSVDLGNLGGAAAAQIIHPTLTTSSGRAQRVPGPDPDLVKNGGIALPASVGDVVMLGDGDSDRVLTECALYRGAQRWRAVNDAPVARVAWADVGQDFNDMVREGTC